MNAANSEPSTTLTTMIAIVVPLGLLLVSVVGVVDPVEEVPAEVSPADDVAWVTSGT